MEFKTLVEQRSHGRIHVDVFYGKQYAGGALSDVGDQTKLGVIQMSDIDPATISSYDPKFAILNLPFLFQDPKQAFTALDGKPGQALATDLYKTGGLKLLGWGDFGPRYLLTARKPIHTLADLKGLKIRVVPSPTNLAIYRALGANPVGMNSSEVPSALTQGVIDGLDYPVVPLVTKAFYNYAHYYTQIAVSYEVTCLVMNEKFWKSLSPADQALIQSVATQVEQKERALILAQQAQDLATAKAKGVQVITVSPTVVAQFRNGVKPVYTQWTQQHGSVLLNEIEAAIKGVN